MVYETSYDVGLKPFNPDKNRGGWSSPSDFFFACVGHAFKFDVMFVVPSMIFGNTGFGALILYFIMLMLCTLPIIFMQTFLGQFSSTGFISVFRIAPLFKGLGYVSLIINLMTLTFYSIFAAIPLFYFFHSLRPVLPWSCEGTIRWLRNHENFTMPCNLTYGKVVVEEHTYLQLPSRLFFMSHMNMKPEYSPSPPTSLRYSWPLMLCSICVWAVVWLVLTKRTEIIGRILRYSTAVVVAILTICAIRFAFLPGAFGKVHLFNSLRASSRQIESYVLIPLLSLGGLGPGWGSILSMASYNKFRTDITKHSWLLCLGQMALMVLGCLVWVFVENFWTSMGSEYLHLPSSRSQWLQFITVPSALTMLEMPHFWSLLFFGMMAAGATNLVIVQLFSVLTSLFDEFERLRRTRRELILLTVGALCICSMMFCSNYGLPSFEFLSRYTILTQILLNLMLLLVVLWVYGRERFQRDLFFMTGRTYYTWMVNVVRFVAPVILLFSFFIAIILSVMMSRYTLVLFTLVSIMVIFPWLLIPGYCIFKISQVTGYIGVRFRRCVRPTDWYPVDPEERQRYEETLNNTDLTHQLTPAEEDA